MRLYLNPPQNAVVISVDEKPALQALARAQGWLRLPNGKAVWGHTHSYKRHGTTTLFAALEVHTGTVKVGHYRRRRSREFLDFMNRIVTQYPETELPVVQDNLNTHTLSSLYEAFPPEEAGGWPKSWSCITPPSTGVGGT